MLYTIARPQIKTGDIILWKTKGLIPGIIQLWSEYSHASLVVRVQEYCDGEEFIFVVEAVGTGLEFRRLSVRMDKTDGEVFWLPVPANPNQRKAMGHFALCELGKGVKYDFNALIGNIFGRRTINPTRWFCSEFTMAALIEGGVEEPTNVAPRPGDLPEWVGTKAIKLDKEFFHA